jgi:Fe-S-cluster containining protein
VSSLVPPWKKNPLRADLLALYGEVDALLSPYTCDGSAECCRFGITNREPYPTAVELAEVEHAVRGQGLKLEPSAGRAAGKRGLPLADAVGACPLLGADGRCRIYASRPFGCRTFFCERAVGPGKVPRSEIQRLARKVADLSARFDPRDPGARPFVRALEGLAGRKR